MKKVLLNWLPPSTVILPSPSMSILKSYLRSRDYDVEIKYWNVLFDSLVNEFWFNDLSSLSVDFAHLAPFFYYIGYEDKSISQRFLLKLQTIKPQYKIQGIDFYNIHLKKMYVRINEIIEMELSNIDFNELCCIGFSAKLHQLYCANILAKKIKEKYPDKKIIIGGLGSRDHAVEMLKLFNFYDYAIWGEGEKSLADLCDLIKNNDVVACKKIPDLAYRDNKEVITTICKKEFIELNSLIPDFFDFLEQTKLSRESLSLTIEGSRGCHWNRCRFCYLNQGYRYRRKSTMDIVIELRKQINYYHIYRFNFLDNDIIGQNLKVYNELLDALISLRQEFPKFEISLAEIVTKDITAKEIKKMTIAGFKHVQIGYESPSNTLLSKIHKKNTFASNLLVIKWCMYCNIKISGANIITNLLEETEDDIFESVQNLHYLRFFLSRSYFHHELSALAINKASRYYEDVINTDDLNKWTNWLADLWLPENYISKTSGMLLMLDFTKSDYNKLWDSFSYIENYYKLNLFEYSVVKTDDSYLYTELCNKEIIAELILDHIDMTVLLACSEKVVNLDIIECVLNEKGITLMMEDIKEKIIELKEANLLYSTIDFLEIVSVINPNFIL